MRALLYQKVMMGGGRVPKFVYRPYSSSRDSRNLLK